MSGSYASRAHLARPSDRRTVARNTHEAIHGWAQQNRPHGRSGNVSFDGPSLYSYAAEIARFVEVKGRIVVLISGRSYNPTNGNPHSPTTSSHVSSARWAV